MITQKLTPLHTEIYKMLNQLHLGFLISLNFHPQIDQSMLRLMKEVLEQLGQNKETSLITYQIW